MSLALTKEEREWLLAEARAAAKSAHAPYSRFRVGAAVLGAKGVHLGANVENASYGLCLCAERAALAGAVAVGDLEIRALAVACIDASDTSGPNERMPCGACRQWIAELAPDAEILVDRIDRVFWIEDLLPMPFMLGDGPEKTP